jgi:transcriptional regulator with XRE-family HTH domain
MPNTPAKHATNDTFGSMLRRIRKVRQIGLVALADASGVDATTISRIENGVRKPPEFGTLVKIAVALGMSETSDEFRELWTAAEHERKRNPRESELTNALLNLSSPITEAERRRYQAALPADVVPAESPVFCADIAELISKSNEEAIRRGAVEVTLRFADGSSHLFQVAKKVSK